MLPGALGGGPGRHLGAVRAAKLLRVKHNAYGVPTGDVIDSFGGVYYGCRFISSVGGGGVDDVTQDPVTIGEWSGDGSDIHAGKKPEVLIAFTDGRRPHPFILGMLYNIKSGSNVTKESTDTGTGGANPGKANIGDYLLKRNGARFMLTKSGDIVLDSAERNRSVKIQVGTKGVLRIGAGKYVNGVYQDDPEMGDGEAEFVLLGLGWLNWFNNNIISAINNLGAGVNALAAAAGLPPAAYTPHTPLVLNTDVAESLLSGIIKLSPKRVSDT